MSRTRIILLFYLLFTAVFARGADTLYVDKETSVTLIPGLNYSYLIDHSGNLTLEDIVDAEFKTEITGSDRDDAYESPVVWVKIVIRNISPGALGTYLYWEPRGHAYIEEDSETFIELRTGHFLPYSVRNVQTTDPLIDIMLPGNGVKTVYLQIIQNEESYEWFGNLDSTLCESSAWLRDVSDRNWQFGIFFGVLFFIILYNLIFYITLRDKSYLMYVLFIAFISLVWANANDFTFRYLYPESGNACITGININFFSMSAGSICYALFTMYYLRTRELLPRWHVVLKIMAVLALTWLILGIVVYSIWKTQIGFMSVASATIIYILVSVFIAAAAIRKKYLPAWYFIIGNGILCVALYVQVTHVFHSSVVFGYISIVQVGTLIQVSMFSLGLARRITVIRDDREKAQEEAISQLKVNEELKTKVNRELEQKVTERTAELSEQKKIVEEKNKDILDSITYAKRLQQAILPSGETWNSALKESFIFYLPKDIVAGDFYWLETRGSMVFAAAADCTGHGVPGAMVSVVCSNALHRAFNEFAIDDPGKLLDKTRELVVETFAKSSDQVKDGMDISLVRIDTITREVAWAGANNPLWYVREGAVNEIKANKQPIGVSDAPLPFTTHQLTLGAGDLLYLFTDGFADQFGGPKGKKFKYKPFQELVLDIAHKPMMTQLEILHAKITDWKGGLEQVDDICVIGIRV